MNKLNISALIISKNEEKMIGRALESLSFVDEVIVIDAESTDRTVEIAKSFPNVKVIIRPWPGFKAQRNFSLTQAKHDWVLIVDADEAVSLQLQNKLYEMFDSFVDNEQIKLPFNGYRIRRVEYFHGEPITATCWYPSRQDRLLNRHKAKYINEIHEYPEVEPIDGQTSGNEKGYIDEPLLHHPSFDIEFMLRKINSYTSIEAHERYKNGERTSVGKILFAFVGAVFRNFINYKGYKHGMRGLVISVMDGVARTMRHIKLWEIELLEKGKKN